MKKKRKNMTMKSIINLYIVIILFANGISNTFANK